MRADGELLVVAKWVGGDFRPVRVEPGGEVFLTVTVAHGFVGPAIRVDRTSGTEAEALFARVGERVVPRGVGVEQDPL